MNVPEPVKSHRFTRWEFIPLALGVGLLWPLVAAWLTFDDRPPLVLGTLRLEPINSPIVEGNDMIVRSHREKHRDDCLVESNRWAVDADGVRYELRGQFWAGGAVEDDHVDLLFKTNRLPPGEYIGSAEATYHCPGWRPGKSLVFQYPVQDFRFRVLPGKGGKD